MRKSVLAVAVLALVSGTTFAAGVDTVSIGGALTTLSNVSGSAKGVVLSYDHQFDGSQWGIHTNLKTTASKDTGKDDFDNYKDKAVYSSLTVGPSYAVTPNFSVNAGVGVAHTKLSTEWANGDKAEYTSTSPVLGVGASYAVTDHFTVNAGYEVTRLKSKSMTVNYPADAEFKGATASTFMVGVGYRW